MYLIISFKWETVNVNATSLGQFTLYAYALQCPCLETWSEKSIKIELALMWAMRHCG